MNNGRFEKFSISPNFNHTETVVQIWTWKFTYKSHYLFSVRVRTYIQERMPCSPGPHMCSSLFKSYIRVYIIRVVTYIIYIFF